MEWFFGIFIFLAGLLVGSFLNVCIYRIPRGNFFAEKNSYCPDCREKIKWYDLFPVVSYLILKGRCRYCKEKISARYPVVEALNGGLWALSYAVFGFNYMTLLVAITLSVLIVISFIDIDIMEIPNSLIIALLLPAAAMFILSFFKLGYERWWEHLIGMGSISALLLIITLITRGGIGAGDIRLIAVSGLFLGWKRIVLSAFIGIIIAAIIATILVLAYGRSKKATIPLAPSLALGIAIAALFGTQIIEEIGRIL